MTDFNKLLEELGNWATGEFLLQLIQFVLWVVFIFVLAWLTRKGLSRWIADNATRYRAKKITSLVSYLLIAFLAVVSFTGKVQYFSIAIGLLTAGLAFALQEVILSIAGWFAIFGAKLYNPGDRIEINGVKGDVIDIGVTRTTLMEIGQWVKSDNYSGRIVQISNAFVFKGPVFNYSTDFPFVWDEIIIPIKYGSDLKLVNSIVQNTADKLLSEYAEFASQHWKVMVNKYLIENANTAPTVSTKLTDNWIELCLRYVVDYQKRRVTKTEIYSEIFRAISESDAKVTLASATFEVVGIPDLKIDMNEKSTD